MSEWKTVRLGDVCKYSKDRIGLDEINLSNYISTENMLPEKGGIKVSSGLPNIKTLSSYNIGDVLISNIRPYFKKIWLANKKGGVSNDVLILRASDNYYDKFLYYVLSEDKFFNYSTLTAKGTKMPRGDKSAIMNYEIPLPPLAEQRRIAGVLSLLDDKIEVNRRINSVLEEMAQAIFKSWFVDGAEDDWEEMSLDDYGEIVCGKTPSKKRLDYFGGNIPFIKIPDMHGNTFIFDTIDTLSEMGKLTQIKKTLPPNSVCVSCIATVGLVSLTVFKSQTNQQINSIIPTKYYYCYYLYFCMKSANNLLKLLASGGTATLNLNTSQFSKIQLKYPGKDLLLEFHKKVEPMFAKIKKNSEEIGVLERIRDLLLPGLMSGKVQIKNSIEES